MNMSKMFVDGCCEVRGLGDGWWVVANLQFSSKCQFNLDVYELLNYLVSILFLADMRLMIQISTDLSVSLI